MLKLLNGFEPKGKMCTCGLENCPLIKRHTLKWVPEKVSMKRSGNISFDFKLNSFPLCDRNDSVHYLPSNTYREIVFVPYILMFDADGYLLSFSGALDANALSCLGAPARPFQHPSARASKRIQNTMCERAATLLVMLSNIVAWFKLMPKKRKKERHTSSQWPINPESFCLGGQRRCDILCQTSTLRTLGMKEPKYLLLVLNMCLKMNGFFQKKILFSILCLFKSIQTCIQVTQT